MRRFSTFLVILPFVGLAACTGLPRLQLPQLPQLPGSALLPSRAAAPQGTAKELFHAALDALQHGEIEKTKLLLRQVLMLEPNHKYAQSLLAQIDADPVQMLGSENFLYKVQSGDTLSLIAKRFLGDPFKFYILARYNGIVISDNLEAGRSIKIPGKKPPPEKIAAPEQPLCSEQPPLAETTNQPPLAETINLRLSEARALYKNRRFAEAAKVLENLRLETTGNTEVDDLLTTVYLSHAKMLADSGRFEEARKLLARALDIHPGNERLKKQLDQIAAYQSAEQTYQEGNQLRNEGQLQKAYEAYKRTLALEPDHLGASAAMLKIKPEVVEAYYADSIRARRRQNFAEALEKLDQLLKIDPNYELAKINRIEIKAILDREQALQQR